VAQRLHGALTSHFGNSARDAVGGGLDGIVGEVGVSGGCLHLVVTEQPPDHGQALADKQAATGETVPQVVNAQVPDARALQDEAPRPVQEGDMGAALQAGNHPGPVFLAPYAAQHRDGRIAQVHDPGAGLGVGQPQLAPVQVHVLPPEREDLPAPAPRQHQQPDGGYRRR